MHRPSGRTVIEEGHAHARRADGGHHDESVRVARRAVCHLARAGCLGAAHGHHAAAGGGLQQALRGGAAGATRGVVFSGQPTEILLEQIEMDMLVMSVWCAAHARQRG